MKKSLLILSLTLTLTLAVPMVMSAIPVAPGIEEFIEDQRARKREVVAIECNVPNCKPLGEKEFKAETTLLLGGESDGLTPEILEKVDDIRYIENFGSTRSVNVGVASGIAMYEWARQVVIKK